MAEDWAEKYRPKSLSEVVGNPGAIEALRKWASAWAEGQPKKRAVVLSGDAGVGKTSAALAMARDFNWVIIELNASDRRNEEAIHRVATLGAITQTFTRDGEFHRAEEGRRKLIVLDEADNLFGTEDRGGAKAIVETVRLAQQPIVLIVNDYYELTRRSPSLRTLCELVKFQPPHARRIQQVLERICAAEELSLGPKVLEGLAEQARGDLRAAINDLQALAEGRTTFDPEAMAAVGDRDVTETVYAALDGLLRTTDLLSARQLFMRVDEPPDFLILWLDENLPVMLPSRPALASGYAALARAGQFLARTRQLQYYRLWAYATDLMTGGFVVAREETALRGQPQYRFPLYLVRRSRAQASRSAYLSLGPKLGRHLHLSAKESLETMLDPFQAIFKADPEFRLRMVTELGLAPAEAAYLLGVDEDAKAIVDLFAEAEAAAEEEPARGPKGPPEGGEPSQRGLSDY